MKFFYLLSLSALAAAAPIQPAAEDVAILGKRQLSNTRNELESGSSSACPTHLFDMDANQVLISPFFANHRSIP